MTIQTRTFPITLNSASTTAVVEIAHFRDTLLATGEIAAIYLEACFCNVSLKSFQLMRFPEYEGDESEAERLTLFTKAELDSQKIGLRILTRKNNTGTWREKAEVILTNAGRKSYFDLLIPYLAKAQVRLLEYNDAIGFQLIDYGNGLLKLTDFIEIEIACTVDVSKKNDNFEELSARIANLELALDGKLINLPANTLLGRSTTAGVVERLSAATFATVTDTVNINFAQTISGAKTFERTVRVAGTGQGVVQLQPGTTINAGYLEIYRGNSTTRNGYIGFDNTNLTYVAENGAAHVFSGGRLSAVGGTIPSIASSSVSSYVLNGNSYQAFVCSAASTNYKIYDICNEGGAFSIRKINDAYNAVTGNVLNYSATDILTIGNPISRSSSLHGAISIAGTTNGYSGIHFPQSFNNSVFMMNSTAGVTGVWSSSGTVNGWNYFFLEGSFRVFNYAAQTEGSFIGLEKGLGALPGYPNNRHPTVRTDFSNLYFSAGGLYSAAMNQNGVWTAISDYYKKTVVEEIDSSTTLEIIKHLPICRYHFNDEDERITRIGTFAQAFWLAFGTGGNIDIIEDDTPTSPNKMMSTADVAGVCLSGIQGLLKRIEDIEVIILN